MYILKKWTTDVEGYYNVEEAICVSEDKELIEKYHKENFQNYLLEEGRDFYHWCKINDKKYYLFNSYCTIGEIPLIK